MTGFKAKVFCVIAIDTAKDVRSPNLLDGRMQLLFGSLVRLIMPETRFHTKRILTLIKAQKDEVDFASAKAVGMTAFSRHKTNVKSLHSS